MLVTHLSTHIKVHSYSHTGAGDTLDYCHSCCSYCFSVWVFWNSSRLGRVIQNRACGICGAGYLEARCPSCQSTDIITSLKETSTNNTTTTTTILMPLHSSWCTWLLVHLDYGEDASFSQLCYLHLCSIKPVCTCQKDEFDDFLLSNLAFWCVPTFLIGWRFSWQILCDSCLLPW